MVKLRFAPSKLPFGESAVTLAMTPRRSSRLSPSRRLRRVDLHPDRGFCSPPMDDLADAGDAADLLGDDGIGIVVDDGQRQRVGRRRTG